METLAMIDVFRMRATAPHESRTSVDWERDSSRQSATEPEQTSTEQSQRAPFLTIVIPAYNEERTIVEIVNRVRQVPVDKQIIVVDDCSRDRTYDVLSQWEHARDITILRHDQNRGKGAAIRTGLNHAQGQFTVIQDADLEYDPQDILSLIAPLSANGTQAVYGSRYLADPIRFWRIRRLFELGVVLLNWSVRLLYGAKLTDEATCYKIFPTTALKAMQLSCERFEFCPEVTAKACRLGIEILELPVSYHPRSAEEGKKIRARDGWEALCTLWKYRTWCPRFADG